MDSTVSLPDAVARQLSAALAAATGQWTGCDWHTRFGQHRIDLEGLTPAQAMLMEGATSGGEALDWREAVNWLRRVEQDARQAEAEAATAVRLALRGHLREALESARLARDIEARYREPRTWQPLCEAIQAALPTASKTAPTGQPDAWPS